MGLKEADVKGFDAESFVQSATVSVSKLENIDLETLSALLEKHQFARITGLIDKDRLSASLQKMNNSFSAEHDRATTGESKDEVKGNFQKLSIGCARHGNVNRPRFMRTFYNPLWSEDIYDLHFAFRIQCQLRNLLAGKPLDYAIDSEEDGVWTAARIHHFPVGGGFMVGHRDTVLPAFYETMNLAFFQTLLLLTEKGKDFETGGGFIQIDGHHVSFEDYCEAGDIAIYNQKTVHGVDDIDVNQPFRQQSLAGRMSGLVTLYRSL